MLSAAHTALLDYGIRLTTEPDSCREKHVQALRDAGNDDAAIHALVQVASYFNYINRVADGLGLEREPG